jgi:uncharacterized protein YbaP (TraB family)
MRRLLLCLALLVATPAFGQPALWKLADADTTIWLFGTIHVLPRAQDWHDPQLDRALDQAQELMLEAVLDQDPGEVSRLLFTLGRSSGLPPLADRVPAAKRPRLAELVRKSGLPPATFDQLESWAAAFVLTNVVLRDMGQEIGLGEGVEPQLSQRFRAAGKPIEGLETAAEQLGYFDAMPEAGQRAFLAATLDDASAAGADFRTLVSAWQRGDTAAIERAFADDPEFTPAVRDLLIRHRDQLWADRLARRLDRPGTVFVAVGAGHLIGPDSVQAMLAKKGLTVVRVR